MDPYKRFSLVHIAILYILGIIIEHYLHAPLFLYIICFFILIVLSIQRMRTFIVPVRNLYIISLIILLGAFNLAVRNISPPASHIIHLAENGHVNLIGSICREPEYSGDRTYLVVAVKHIKEEGLIREVTGRVKVTLDLPQSREFQYGDEIKLYCRLRIPKGKRNPGDADYQAYLKRQGILTVAYVDKAYHIEKIRHARRNPLLLIAIAIKDSFRKIINSTTSPPYDALLTGLLLGDDSHIPDDIKDDFRKCGVYHVLAVSGLHVGVVCLLLLAILRKIGLIEKVAVPLVLFFLVIYVLATGWRWSVIRASIMMGTGLIGALVKKDKCPYTSLALAAIIILLKSPLALFDVGFQLSFIATLSIMLFNPIIFSKANRSFLWNCFCAGLSISLAAQIGTAPLVAYYFNQISFISPIANLIISPLVALSIQLGFLAYFLGVIILPLGMAINAANELILALIIKCSRFFSLIPFAWCYVGTPSHFFLVIYYAISFWIYAGSLYTHIFKREDFTVRKRSFIGVCIIITILIWGQCIQILSPVLIITFIDVGQGDSILIEAPGGVRVLIDGGGRERSQEGGFDVGEEIIVPFLRRRGVRRLDLVILSHPHEDHVGGLCAVLEEFTTGQVLEYDPLYMGEEKYPYAYRRFREIIKEGDIRLTRVCAGTRVFINKECELEVLHPGSTPITGGKSDINNNSLVLRLRYKDTYFLFTGDIEKEGEDALIRSGVKFTSHLLKVAHHGGNTSTSTNFIRYTEPEYGIISVGPNPFGHPSDATLSRLMEENIEIYRTDINGAIIVRSNGKRIALRTVR